MARRTGVSFPLLSDPLKIAMRRYAVVGTPTSFIIDARGVIRERIDGPLSGQALQQRIAGLL
jgi:cytochrome c biogenesis protein CcmG, thiol:disulfide interchange protein DsbE